MDALVVVIASPDRLGALQDRVAAEEVVGFPDVDVLRALELITRRRPTRVVLDARFAATSRGTALRHRLGADPYLSSIAVDIAGEAEAAVARPGTGVRTEASGAGRTAPRATVVEAVPSELDQRGTRRAPRVVLQSGVDAIIDGARVRVVDLSVVGAQVTSPGVLKPNQRVRFSVADQAGPIRCTAVVAWARFELPRDTSGSAIYRAGLEFIDPHMDRLSAFAERHRAR